ncbi:potassium ABC transporter ATPase [Nodularia spumigena CENA596]|uniref:Potassium ABC transporter ATPase n=1 Tax=Nodularia spumigena CENA596 TaxID=1819295 RepID=A0A166L0K2_NODSP|nr:potassium ABC transporter ATPase [Nodularia spumigena CENA596]
MHIDFEMQYPLNNISLYPAPKFMYSKGQGAEEMTKFPNQFTLGAGLLILWGGHPARLVY